jgi:hypothetical protein
MDGIAQHLNRFGERALTLGEPFDSFVYRHLFLLR